MGRQDLRIVISNANGIRNKIHELEILLNLQQIDVGLISETHLIKQSYIKLKGFKIYSTIHPVSYTHLDVYKRQSTRKLTNPRRVISQG